MKLAFSTLPCATWSLEKTAQICRDSGIDAIEIRTNMNAWSDTGQTAEELKQMRELLDQYGVLVSDLGTTICVKSYDLALFEELHKCRRMAAALGAKGLRIFLGNFYGRFSEAPAAPDFNAIVQWLKEACAIAAQDGLELWIETHNEYSSGKVLRHLLDTVQAPNLKVVWDLIHPVEVGEDYPETLAYLGKDIAHIHIKDGTPYEDFDMATWLYTRLGEGTLPVPAMVAALEAAGYDGFYSLEWESAWRPEIRGEGFEGEVVIQHFAKYMNNLNGDAQ
jgi:sugar phosphate isomerase/epimerase